MTGAGTVHRSTGCSAGTVWENSRRIRPRSSSPSCRHIWLLPRHRWEVLRSTAPPDRRCLQGRQGRRPTGRRFRKPGEYCRHKLPLLDRTPRVGPDTLRSRKQFPADTARGRTIPRPDPYSRTRRCQCTCVPLRSRWVPGIGSSHSFRIHNHHRFRCTRQTRTPSLRSRERKRIRTRHSDRRFRRGRACLPIHSRLRCKPPE